MLAPGTYYIGTIADSTGVQPEAKVAGRSRKIHKVAVPAVVSARMKSGLSQTAFAQLLGVSVRTVQDWEQGRPPTQRRGQDAHRHCRAQTQGSSGSRQFIINKRIVLLC